MSTRFDRHTVVAAARNDAVRYRDGGSSGNTMGELHEIVEYRYGRQTDGSGISRRPQSLFSRSRRGR